MKLYKTKTETLIYLASASPRRKQLLGEFGINIKVFKQNVEEKTEKIKPNEIVMALAELKVDSLIKQLDNNLLQNDSSLVQKGDIDISDVIILGADTIVWRNLKQYGKPKDENEAEKFLNELSGKWHSVYTGVCLQKGQNRKMFWRKSLVKFKKLSVDEISQYIATKSPMDKAGAYGIQDNEVVEKYKGSYTNIVGLPMEKLRREIRRMEEK